MYFSKLFDWDDYRHWVMRAIILVILVALFPMTVIQNYQNYRKLSYVLISSIVLSFVFCIIQLIVWTVQENKENTKF